ncbi:MAG: toprim domain-containing protein [Candidatus Liptonbacteria bacterium]
MTLPDSIKQLADKLAELPSIGPRQAIRLVFYFLNQGNGFIGGLAKEVDALRKLKFCANCHFVHQNEDELCEICSNPERDQTTILLVEKETDLLSLENTGKYHGRYLILGDIPKAGLLENWQKERLESLKTFIKKKLDGQAKEIILGVNPTSVGDFHASILNKELVGLTKKISRLGRGLPTGGEIEFADDETLGSALERRD